MKINAKERVETPTNETRYIVAFDHLDLGSEIQRHVEKARNLRSAYCSELMARIWGWAARWLGKGVPSKIPPETTAGQQHRAGS